MNAIAKTAHDGQENHQATHICTCSLGIFRGSKQFIFISHCHDDKFLFEQNASNEESCVMPLATYHGRYTYVLSLQMFQVQLLGSWANWWSVINRFNIASMMSPTKIKHHSFQWVNTHWNAKSILSIQSILCQENIQDMLVRRCNPSIRPAKEIRPEFTSFVNLVVLFVPWAARCFLWRGWSSFV